MAFHASAGLVHTTAAATKELGLVMASGLKTSLQNTAKRSHLTAAQTQTTTRSIHLTPASHVPPSSSLPRGAAAAAPRTIPPEMQTLFTANRGLATGSHRSLPTLSKQMHNISPVTRSYHSLTSRINTTLAPRVPLRATQIGLIQSRSIFGSSWTQNNSMNQNLLAQMEQTANNNPGSATAQNAFYQALLRANMPEIIVERYNTGRYASNSACENVYTKALERIGAAETGSLGSFAGRTPGGQSHHLSDAQLQAVGQAISANHRGSNISVSKQGSGAKNEPLYVVVDETLSSVIFKWVKFIVYFALVAYITLVSFTLLIEMTGVLRRVGGAQNAEAKPELQTTTFNDVQGCEEAKEELQELVEFLKNPERFSTLGGKLPKGVLLVGPPGTGKTLLARAVAGESGVPFFYMSGSEFDEIYVGVGAKRMRELFISARGKAPAIVFIDELDAIGGKRNERDATHARQTLNQLLTELDGFDQNSNVIIIAATNFPQSLDKALTRPGRFDRNVNVPLPDVRGRIAILKHHLRNIKLDPDVDAAVVARGCPGFSGAELENIVNQAAVRASKNKASMVTMEDLVWAKDRVMMGAERRSAVIQDKDKLMTAYHEGGHALVALLTEGATPLYKATIMPRGQALGVTSMLPELDKVSESKREILAQIAVSMGGKVAEEIVYGPEAVTTGASSDITNATSYAYHMVTQAGMSPLLGNIDLRSNYDRLSSETKLQIESEVRRIVEEGKQAAHKLLTENREGLNRLAHALVEYETLTRDEIEKVVKGEKLLDKISGRKDAPIKLPEQQKSLLSKPPFGLPPLGGKSSNSGKGGGSDDGDSGIAGPQTSAN